MKKEDIHKEVEKKKQEFEARRSERRNKIKKYCTYLFLGIILLLVFIHFVLAISQGRKIGESDLIYLSYSTGPLVLLYLFFMLTFNFFSERAQVIDEYTRNVELNIQWNALGAGGMVVFFVLGFLFLANILDPKSGEFPIRVLAPTLLGLYLVVTILVYYLRKKYG